MVNRRGNWAALWTRLSLDSRIDLRGMRQARLRRQVNARMRAHGLEAYEEYLRLLEGHPGEFAALVGALRSDLYRAGPSVAQPRRMFPRQWIDTLPLAAVLAEAVPATGGLRLLSYNRPAQDLLTAPECVLECRGSRHRWLFPNLEPCSNDDMPLQRAIWQGAPTRNQTLLFQDGAGCLQPLAVNARRLPGAGLPRALATLQPSEAWQADEGAQALLAGFNEAQEQCARYRRLFAESPAALIVTGPDGTIEEASEQAGALIGPDLGPPGSSLAAALGEEVLPALQSALDTGEARAQLRPRSRPGCVLEAHARRLLDGREARVQWALHDVTAQVETERQRSDLTDLMLHDMRSPLATALLGLDATTSILQRDGQARGERMLAMTRGALRRLGRLVDSLLDISRLEAGQMGLALAEVRADELLAEVAAEAELVIANHNLRLELETAPDLPVIVADRDMVFRAVVNLVDNAVKFSPPEGQVSLRAAPERAGLAISVTDEGPGIPPEFLPRIFDKFVGLSLPEAPRGYGLGLAFCKLAAEAHGGAVTVDSAPRRGSTFTLWFPGKGT